MSKPTSSPLMQKLSPFLKLLALVAAVVLVIFAFDRLYLSRQFPNLADSKTDISPTPNPIEGQPIFFASPTPNLINAVENGYQNPELNFALSFDQAWELDERSYVANAKSLWLNNPAAAVKIQLNYLAPGLEGQTGPTNFSGEMVKNGSLLLAGKNLDRHEVFEEIEGKKILSSVVYTAAGSRKLDFILKNLQFSLMLSANNLETGLSEDSIKAAEKVLATFRFTE